MGDARRFDAFADLIVRNVAPETAIADVAGGKGGLMAALYRRQYRNVESWDKRHKNAQGRRGYQYGYFDWRSAPRHYGCVVGMHADEATDHVVMYALKHRVPFILCPCCVKPNAAKFTGNQYEPWIKHLGDIARIGGYNVIETALPIHGRSRVLIGRP
ncbi:MAG: hypothetical protein Q7N50_10775 [Armatimonadota bacterium]|nr:hypothetical protein [Armatimonadota bacterium]